MAEFPPNLDDGELWLPSDIIRDVGARHPTHNHSQHYRRPSPAIVAGYDFDYVEGLAQQLAALRLLEARAAAAATLVKAPVRSVHLGQFGPVDSELGPVGLVYDRFREKTMGLYSGNGDVLGSGFRGNSLAGYNLLKPMERFGGPMVQGIPSRPAVPRRWGPAVHPSTGGLKRESSGTGVFFPRVGNVKYDSDVKGTKKKPQVVKGVGVEPQNRNHLGTKNGVVVLKHQQGSMLFQPPTEMALPADWTY